MNNRGYTVVEVLVALVLFSIIVLPIADLLVAEIRFSKKFEQKTAALFIAESELEKAKQSYRMPTTDEYTLTSGNGHWRVKRSVETIEKSLNVTSTKERHFQELKQPSEIVKTFITITVFNAQDTSALCEFRVMKDTYQ